MSKRGTEQSLASGLQAVTKPPLPHLPLLVDPDDPGGSLVRRRHKDGLCADSIHVDAHSRLQVVQVNVAVLCDQINDAVLAANLNVGEKPFPMSFHIGVELKLVSSWSGRKPTCMATGKSV